MRLKFLVDSASPAGAFKAGAIADVADDEGRVLLDTGVAERVRRRTQVETVPDPEIAVSGPAHTATVKPQQTAVVPPPQPVAETPPPAEEPAAPPETPASGEANVFGFLDGVQEEVQADEPAAEPEKPHRRSRRD